MIAPEQKIWAEVNILSLTLSFSLFLSGTLLFMYLTALQD